MQQNCNLSSRSTSSSQTEPIQFQVEPQLSHSDLKHKLVQSLYLCQPQCLSDELKIQESFPGYTSLLLWNIWELIITGTSLLIVGNNPKECSHAVLTALSLIHPLTSAADVRPYLTVLNSDTEYFCELVKKKQTPDCIIGIANPLLVKNLS